MVDSNETKIRMCMQVFSDNNIKVDRMSMYQFGLRFETLYTEQHPIHGQIIIETKDIQIATSACYRTLEETKSFTKRLKQIIKICEKCKKIGVE